MQCSLYNDVPADKEKSHEKVPDTDDRSSDSMLNT
jgi:hypothetical protein